MSTLSPNSYRVVATYVRGVPACLVRLTRDVRGWKKTRLLVARAPYRRSSVITELRIPKGALVYFSNFHNKLRASSAWVVKMTEYTAAGREVLVSRGLWAGGVKCRGRDFLYRKGKRVRPRKPFDRSPETCASGIHFFLTKKEARQW